MSAFRLSRPWVIRRAQRIVVELVCDLSKINRSAK